MNEHASRPEMVPRIPPRRLALAGVLALLAAATPSPVEAEPADHGLGIKIPFQHRHLLGISQLNQFEILELLNRAEAMFHAASVRRTKPTSGLKLGSITMRSTTTP